MKISIVAVGRCGRLAEAELIKRYLERTPWDVSIKEIEERRPIKGDERKKNEATLIEKALSKNPYIIVLDEHGKNQTSTKIAQTINKAAGEGFDQICFIIGGADGLAQNILDKAHLKISFGAQVWPHMMVRAMLAEQIYRSWCILNNHPYHKE